MPGWLYQVKNGATTIWERWDAIRADGTIFDPEMNSYNHYAYGAVCQWLFEAVAGFRPDPERAGLPAHHLRADDHSRHCRRSRRTTTPPPAASRPAGRVDGDKVTYHIVVPDGASGTLVLDRATRTPSSTARRSPRPAATEVAQPARARDAQRDVPDQQRVLGGRSQHGSRNRAGDRHGKQGGRQ